MDNPWTLRLLNKLECSLDFQLQNHSHIPRLVMVHGRTLLKGLPSSPKGLNNVKREAEARDFMLELRGPVLVNPQETTLFRLTLPRPLAEYPEGTFLRLSLLNSSSDLSTNHETYLHFDRLPWLGQE